MKKLKQIKKSGKKKTKKKHFTDPEIIKKNFLNHHRIRITNTAFPLFNQKQHLPFNPKLTRSSISIFIYIYIYTQILQFHIKKNY